MDLLKTLRKLLNKSDDNKYLFNNLEIKSIYLSVTILKQQLDLKKGRLKAHIIRFKNNTKTQMSRSCTVSKVANSNNSHKKTNLYKDDYYYYQQKSQGLPNLGNICFLNSAIQFLYSSSMFRKAFLKQNYQNNSFQDNLKRIFGCIQYQKSDKEKIHALTQIIKQLQQLEDSYKFSTQHDCSHFILLILNHIGQKYPNILQLFKLYYWVVCQNCQERYKKVQYIIFNETIICEKCQQGIMKIQFISQPNCIIFHKLKIKNTSQPYKISTVRNQELDYNLKAKVIYSGNGSFGHYRLSRRKNVDDLKSKFYIFSDSTIYQEYQQSYYRSVQTPLLSLYEFQKDDQKQKIQQNNQLNNRKQAKVGNQNQLKKKSQQQKIYRNSSTKMDVQEKKNSNNVVSFLNNLKLQTLASILMTIFNVESLKSKIQRVSSQSPIFKLIQKYSEGINSSNLSIISQHQKQTYLVKIIEFLKQQDKDFQKFIQKYYTLTQSKSFNVDEDIQQKIYSFIRVIWFICILNYQIKPSFQWSYKNYCQQKNKYEEHSMKLFFRRYSQTCCKKQIYLQKCQLLKNPRYIIIIEKQNQLNQKRLLLQNKPYVDYILRSYLKTVSSKEEVFIKIYQIKNITFQVEVKLPSESKYFSNEVNYFQIKPEKIFDLYSHWMSKYKLKSQNFNMQLFINQNPVNANSSLNRKLINLINSKNGNSITHLEYPKKPPIKFNIKEKY